MKSYTSGFPQTASTSWHTAPKQFIPQFLNYFINSKLKDVVPALFTLTHGEHSSENTSFSHLQISRANPLPIQKPGGKIILVSDTSVWLQPYTELFLKNISLNRAELKSENIKIQLNKKQHYSC